MRVRERFNPRPGADTGATRVHTSHNSGLNVSIRAPVRTPGRPDTVTVPEDP